MTSSPEPLRIEATGETLGEAKWLALRELEKLAPGLDKSAVEFEVVAEGERGLLGVGYAPARVIATIAAAAAAAGAGSSPAAGSAPAADESPFAADVREVVERIVGVIGVHGYVEVREDDESVVATVSGGDLGLLIGRHGQTIDAVQYVLNAIAYRAGASKAVVVDAAGYRDRRRATVESLAERAAQRARSTGQAVELEPMSSVERRIVHLRLADEPGVQTRSEGDEPHRYVVVEPA